MATLDILRGTRGNGDFPGGDDLPIDTDYFPEGDSEKADKAKPEEAVGIETATDEFSNSYNDYLSSSLQDIEQKMQELEIGPGQTFVYYLDEGSPEDIGLGIRMEARRHGFTVLREDLGRSAFLLMGVGDPQT